MQETLVEFRQKEELYYGPVVITEGPLKGRVGLYDDDCDPEEADCYCYDSYELGEEECDSCASDMESELAIVYLWGETSYTFVDPIKLKNLKVEDDADFFSNTMWGSIEHSHNERLKAEAAKLAAQDFSKIPGLRAFNEMPRPVVYFLMLGESLQYIGQTISIGARIAAHKKDKQFDSVKCIDVPEEDLSAIETALIRHFVPPLNKTVGKLTPSDVQVLQTIGIETNIDRKPIFGTEVRMLWEQ